MLCGSNRLRSRCGGKRRVCVTVFLLYSACSRLERLVETKDIAPICTGADSPLLTDRLHAALGQKGKGIHIALRSIRHKARAVCQAPDDVATLRLPCSIILDSVGFNGSRALWAFLNRRWR